MSGVAIASAIEGVRPFLIETQALVAPLFMVIPNVRQPDLIYEE